MGEVFGTDSGAPNGTSCGLVVLIALTMQEIIHELHAPIATDVVQAVQTAYRTHEPLLPYTELPAIAISGLAIPSASILRAAR